MRVSDEAVCSVGGAAAWKGGAGGGMAVWRVLRCGSLEGVVAWRFGWRGEGERCGGLAGWERENGVEVWLVGRGRVK